MTCIVGLVEDGKVIIGGDSQTTSGWVSQSLAPSNPKVFRVGPFLIGVAGSGRPPDLLRYRFQVPEHPAEMSNSEYLTTRFIDEYRRVLKDGGASETKNGSEKIGSDDDRTTLIVGYRGHLYTVWSNFQVFEYDTPYVANGCGWEFALGALYAIDVGSTVPLSAIGRVRIALEAAARYSAACGAPFVIEELQP